MKDKGKEIESKTLRAKLENDKQTETETERETPACLRVTQRQLQRISLGCPWGSDRARSILLHLFDICALRDCPLLSHT